MTIRIKNINSWKVLSDFAIALIALFCITQIKHLNVDHSFNRLFPKKEDDFIFFEKYSERFGLHEEDKIILICLSSETGIFNKTFLNRLDSFVKQMEPLKDVNKIYSLTRISYPYFDQGRLISRPLININNSENWYKDSIFIFNSSEYTKTLFSIDKKSVLVSVFPKIYTPETNYKELLSGIELLAHSIFPANNHVLSKAKMNYAYQLEVKKSIQTTSAIALLLISAVLIILSRSFGFVINSYLAIFLTIIITSGILGLTNGTIDYLTGLLPIILGIIVLTNMVHFRYYFESSHSKAHTIKESFNNVGLSVLLANITTAIGFLTLCFTHTESLIQFGQFASLGILMAYCLSYYISFRESVHSTPSAPQNLLPDPKIGRLAEWIMNKRFYVLGSFALITSIAIFYASKIEINGNLLNEFHKNHPILRDIKYFDSAFGGSRMVEINISSKNSDSGFHHIENLKSLDNIIRYLEDSMEVFSIISPLTMIKAANKAYLGGDTNQFRLPDKDQQLTNYISAISQTTYGEEMDRYFIPDGSEVRVSGRIKNMNLKESIDFENRIQDFIKSNDYSKKFTLTVTGESFLMDKTPQFLVRNLKWGLLLSILIMSLIGYFILGRLSLIPIAILPNLIPLITLGGIMGLFDIYLKTDTAILFTIAFGMSVDNTIHMLNRFRLECLTQDWQTSIINAYMRTIKPVGLTIFLLCAGLFALNFSELNSGRHFGMLISAALILSLITNAALLPALLSLASNNKPQINQYHGSK